MGVLIYTSEEELFGVTFIEIMAQKVLVVVGTTSGAVLWVLTYGKVGVLVDVNNSIDILEKKLEILVDKTRCKQMIDMHIYAKENFWLDNVKNRYYSLYKKI